MTALEADILWAPDIFGRHDAVDRIFHLYALSVRPDHRSRGIARKLLEESLEVGAHKVIPPPHKIHGLVQVTKNSRPTEQTRY